MENTVRMYFFYPELAIIPIVSILLAGDFFPLLLGLNLNFSILLPIENAFSNYCILSLYQ